MSDGFKSHNAVLKYLQGEGYKVSRGKVYSDKARLPKGADGRISLAVVEQYIRAQGLKKTGVGENETPDPEASALGMEKQREEIRKIRAQASKEEFDLDVKRGKYLPRDQFEQEMATRALVLDAGLRRLVRERAADWVFHVAGDKAKVRELQDLLNVELDGLMNEYASLESFQVMVVADEDNVSPYK